MPPPAPVFDANVAAASTTKAFTLDLRPYLCSAGTCATNRATTGPTRMVPPHDPGELAAGAGVRRRSPSSGQPAVARAGAKTGRRIRSPRGLLIRLEVRHCSQGLLHGGGERRPRVPGADDLSRGLRSVGQLAGWHGGHSLHRSGERLDGGLAKDQPCRLHVGGSLAAYDGMSPLAIAASTAPLIVSEHDG